MRRRRVRRQVSRQVHRPHRVPRRRHLGRVAARAEATCSTVPRSSTSRCRPACSPTRRRRSPRPASPTRPNGWRRLVIEKPFGTDLESALALNEQLHRATGAKTRSSASTTSSARRRCRTCSCSGSRTGSSSPCSTSRPRRRDPDHRGRDARRRGPVALLRRHRRAARHDPEPPHADDDVRDDGAARALGRGDAARPQGRGAQGGAHARSRHRRGARAVHGRARRRGSRASAYRAEPGVDPHVAHRHVRRGATAPRHVAVGRRARCCCGRASGSRPRRTRSRSASGSRRRACSATRRSSTPSPTGSCSA